MQIMEFFQLMRAGDNLSQMPDEEFDMFVKKFNIPHDGVKL